MKKSLFTQKNTFNKLKWKLIFQLEFKLFRTNIEKNKPSLLLDKNAKQGLIE